MKPSPLQLERHFFTKVHLDANLEADAAAVNTIDCEVEVGQSKDDPLRFQVMLKLSLSPCDGRLPPYTGEFHAVGLFKVAETWPVSQRTQLVEINGASMLYGALREVIITLTARGPWPPVTLGSVSFVKPPEKPAIQASTTVTTAIKSVPSSKRAAKK